MYAPLPATAAEIAAGYASVDGAEDFEFVELQNIGTTALPLQGLAFTNGVSFTFPNVSLAAGAIHRRLLRPGRLRHPLRFDRSCKRVRLPIG